MAGNITLGKFQKVWGLLLSSEKRFACLVLAMTVLLPAVELMGIGGIFGFIDIVISPEKIATYEWLAWIKAYLAIESDTGFILFLGIGAILSLIVRNIFLGLHLWLKTWFGLQLSASLASRLLSTYLHSPYQFFVSNSSSILLKNVNSESQLLSTGFMIPLLTIAASIFVFISIIAALIIYDPKVTIFALGILGVLYGTIYLLVRKTLLTLGTLRFKFNSDRFQFTNQALCGVQDIKVLGREGFFLDRSTYIFHKLARLSVVTALLSKVPRLMLEVFIFGGIVSVVIFAVYTNIQVVENISKVALYAVATYRLMPHLDGFLSAFNSLRFNSVVVDTIQNHLDMPIEEKEVVGAETSKLLFRYQIVFDDVSFLYEQGRNQIVTGMNIAINYKQSVAFVGPSGVGKSTVVNIILGLLEPTNGAMLVDDEKITHQNKRRWQKNIGFVPQDIYLSDDTIINNIAFGIPYAEINVDRVKEAARLAQIRDFIESELDDGYETFVGERGIRLSGGQKQRLGIARALYHDPELLIFDEATSALDGITENIITDTINSIASEKTIIVIAHRLSTVKKCDVIYVLKNGQVDDVGTYQELMARNEMFRQMDGAEPMA